MTRKLLPYEYELIQELGISKEEYLEFLALQMAYNDPKKGTSLDIQNGIEWYAFALTVIGLIFQVVSALLMPTPNLGGGQRQSREERFSPRFGFNSTQELAKYGDPVPLVYTDTSVNSAGGVRVAGSLLWSAVRSYGSSQFLQMLMVLSGGAIRALDHTKAAFGQTAVTDLVTANKWMYFTSGGTGALAWSSETASNAANDPTKYGGTSDNPYLLQPVINNEKRKDGYSQAYSPSSAATFGVYSPVPINVDVYLRAQGGLKNSTNNGITARGWPTGYLKTVAKGDPLIITFATTKNMPTDNKMASSLARQAAEIRRTLSSVFDESGMFKFGSSVYQVQTVDAGVAGAGASTDEGDVTVTLKCITGGYTPSLEYTNTAITSLTNKKQIDFSTLDDIYYLKIIGRYEEATYTTVSPCNIVDIALKVQVFRRISGRQERYGTLNIKGYTSSDNGICHRTSLFIVKYKSTAATSWDDAEYVPGIFAVRRAADNDNFVYLKFNGGSTAAHWQFKLQPIIDPAAEVKAHPKLAQSNGSVDYFYMQNSGNAATFTFDSTKSIYFTGFKSNSTKTFSLPPLNESPSATNEWDWFNLDADTQLQHSFERGPEFKITAVSEQLIEDFSPTLYKDLALIGFNVYSGKNLQDMRSFTSFVTKGRPVRILRTSGQDENNNEWGSAKYKYYSTKPIDTPDDPDIGPTCFAPDIFLDTVLDPNDGIGKYAQVKGIDLKQLAETKRFCKANNLFMDGVIADLQSWREFWVNTAPFSLLEFSRSGGRESLVPAVPYDPKTGEIKTKIEVCALFNQGNILEDSYKEENLDYGSSVQDLIATVVYRNLDANGVFAVNQTVEVKLADSVEADAIRQNFDLSAFVTTKAQAILFAKLLCNTRRHVRTAIEFKTFPTTSPVAPGAFIYVDIGQNDWDGVRTGVIGPGGKLNMPIDNRVTNGSYEMLLYQTGRGVAKQPVSVSSGVATNLDEKYEGYLFVLGISKANTRRVFRVNQVEMDEEGEVLVRATGYPCDPGDNSKIANFADCLFTVDQKPPAVPC